MCIRDREASLRRFAHYDYWLDTVLPSIAESSGADIISFGMGEHQTVEIARRLAAGERYHFAIFLQCFQNLFRNQQWFVIEML